MWAGNIAVQCLLNRRCQSVRCHNNRNNHSAHCINTSAGDHHQSPVASGRATSPNMHSTLSLSATAALMLLLVVFASLLAIVTGDNNSNAAVFQFPEYDYKETSKNVSIDFSRPPRNVPTMLINQPARPVHRNCRTVSSSPPASRAAAANR